MSQDRLLLGPHSEEGKTGSADRHCQQCKHADLVYACVHLVQNAKAEGLTFLRMHEMLSVPQWSATIGHFLLWGTCILFKAQSP